MIHLLIWNSAVSRQCLNVWTAQFDWRSFSEFEENFRNVISRMFQTVIFAKVYLAVIFGLHFGMHLLSRSVFVRMIFFHSFTICFIFPYYFLQESWFYRYPPLSDKFNFFMIWMNSYFLSSISYFFFIRPL